MVIVGSLFGFLDLTVPIFAPESRAFFDTLAGVTFLFVFLLATRRNNPKE